MKQSILFLAMLLVSVSCLKEDVRSGDPRFMSVEAYIALLKSGKFNTLDVPIFEISDIPKLFPYVRNEQTVSIHIDTPLYSSVRYDSPMNVALGMMALWTIEGTRLDVDCPSPTPSVINSDGYSSRLASLAEVADLYEHWWEKNSGKTAAQLKEISPFEGTNFFWR